MLGSRFLDQNEEKKIPHDRLRSTYGGPIIVYQNKFPHDSTKYYGGPITPYSDKFPHDSTKYYGGPITAFSDKFNVT